MRQGTPSTQSFGLAIAAVLTTVLWGFVPSAAAKDDVLERQLAFGIQMAKRGLWNEAAFRFSRVLEQQPGDVRVLNNLAVAYEAVGEFDLALEHYKRALEGDSANRELRRNYTQFVEFYESLRPTEGEAAETATGSADAEDAADAEVEAVEAPEDVTENATEPDGSGD